MKRNSLVKLITFAVLLVLVVVLACVLKTDVPGADSRYFGTFMALIPPVIAIVCALVTKEVYSSLFIGILAGGLFAAEFNPVGTFDAVVIDGLIAAVSDTAGIFCSSCCLAVWSPCSTRQAAAALSVTGHRSTSRPASAHCLRPSCLAF